MDDFECSVQASKVWLLFLLGFYLLGFIYVLTSPFKGQAKLLFVTLISVYALVDILCWNKQRLELLRIRLQQQQWYVSVSKDLGWKPVELQRYFTSPWLIVLRSCPKQGGKQCYHYCFRDALTTSNWRKLQSYLAVFS